MIRSSRNRRQPAVHRQNTTAVSSPSAERNRLPITFYLWAIGSGLLAEQHEGNRRYSYPVVVIKSVWNLAFIVVAFFTLILTLHEKPERRFRLWISVYSLICVVRVLTLWLEYTKRNTRIRINNAVVSTLMRSSTVLETLNIEFNEAWMWFGGWCIHRIGEIPPPDAPGLFWLTLACVFPGLFCLHIRSWRFVSNFSSLFIKRGASDAGISMLPKYKFEMSIDENQADGRACRMVPMSTNGPEFSAEHVLLVQDAECCICLCNYEDGAELYSLPCNHHFHTRCIREWLVLRASCPLCKREMIR